MRDEKKPSTSAGSGRAVPNSRKSSAMFEKGAKLSLVSTLPAFAFYSFFRPSSFHELHKTFILFHHSSSYPMLLQLSPLSTRYNIQVYCWYTRLLLPKVITPLFGAVYFQSLSVVTISLSRVWSFFFVKGMSCDEV